MPPHARSTCSSSATATRICCSSAGIPVPEFGQREQLVDRAVLTIGGSASITACGAARLGLSTALVASVGRDHFGSHVLEQVAARGVDVSRVPASRRRSDRHHRRPRPGRRPRDPDLDRSHRGAHGRGRRPRPAPLGAAPPHRVVLPPSRPSRRPPRPRRGGARRRHHRLARPAGRPGRALGVRASPSSSRSVDLLFVNERESAGSRLEPAARWWS